MRSSPTLLSLLLVGLFAPAGAQVPPLRGTLSFTGMAAELSPVSELMAFDGISFDAPAISGTLVFEGRAAAQPDISGSMAFLGANEGQPEIGGAVSFFGRGGEGPGITGEMAFAGLAVEPPSIAGTLVFRGPEVEPPRIAGKLAFVGLMVEPPSIAGPLAFSGCDQLVTAAETPPDFLDPESDPNIALEGNYIITWTDADRPTAYATLAKGGGMGVVQGDDGYNLFEFTRDADAAWALSLWFPPPHTMSASASYAESVEMKGIGAFEVFYNYGILGYWGGSAELTATDAGASGDWFYRDQTGKEVWTRVEAEITDVMGLGPRSALSPETAVALVTPYWGPVYSMRGNREDITLRLLGNNMWGRHYFWIARGSGLEVGRWHSICETAGAESFERCDIPGRIAGVDISLNVWDDARTGPQTLFFDGVEIPFFLEVTGAPPPEKACRL